MERETLIHQFALKFKQLKKKSRIEFVHLLEKYIPFNEFLILRELEIQNNLMVSQIAEKLNVSNSHITTVSEKLVKKGLIFGKEVIRIDELSICRFLMKEENWFR